MASKKFLSSIEAVGIAQNFFIIFIKAYTNAENPVILRPTIKELISFVPS